MSNLQIKTRIISAEDARELLNKTRYQKQRTIRSHQVRRLTRIMESGEFRQGTPIDIAVVGQKSYLVNGQHTLTAIAQCGKPQELLIVKHPCKNMDEVGALYVGFDRQLRRTPQDVVSGYGIDIGNIGGKVGRALYGASGLIGAGFISFNTAKGSTWWEDLPIRSRLFGSWLPEAELIREDISNTPYSSLLHTGPVLAVALVTYRFAKDASAFWNGLVRDDALPQGDPRKALLFAHADKTKFRRVVYQQHVIARYVISCWNSFRRGQTRINISHGDLTKPVRIHDTPHDGKAVMTYVTADGEILREPVAVEDKK